MATAFKQVKNGSKSTLAGTITNTVTTLTVKSGQGVRFQVASGSFWATIWNKALYWDPRDDPGAEIVLVTARSGDTLTIVRGQLDTTNVSHSANDAIEMLLLDQHFIDVYNAINALEANSGGNGDIEITDASKGVILKSPNGTRWRVQVTDNGNLTTTSI